MSARAVIYKHRVDAHGRQFPAGRIVHVGTQFDAETGVENVHAWVEHSLGSDGDVLSDRKMTMKIVGTGHPFDYGWDVAGTAQFSSVPLVMHVLVYRGNI